MNGFDGSCPCRRCDLRRWSGVDDCDDYMDGSDGEPEAARPAGPGDVEVLLRGPSVSVAAVRTWIVSRAGLAEAALVEHRTVEDPARLGGSVCRMLVVTPEE